MLKLIIIKSYKYYLLDLGNTKSISFELNSEIWNFESIPGTFSIPFTVPATATNNAIFDFPHSQTNTNQNKRFFDCQLLVNGLLFYEGSITVSETTTGEFKCSLKLNQSKFIENNVDKLLNESNFGGSKPWIWKSKYDFDNSDFALYSFVGTDFFKGTIAEDFMSPEIACNNYDANDNRYVLQYVIEQTQNLTTRPYKIVPQPFLAKTIKYLFQYLGYFVANNCFESSENLQKIAIHNINNITDIIMTEPVEKNYRYTTLLDNYNLNQSMPKITIQDFILNIKNFFCVDFSFKNNDLKINFIKDYILSTDFIDITDKCLTDEIKTWRTTGQTFEIKFGDFFNSELKTKTSAREIINAKTKGTLYMDFTDENNFNFTPKVGDVWVNVNAGAVFMDYRNIKMNNLGELEEYWESLETLDANLTQNNMIFQDYFIAKTADIVYNSNVSPYDLNSIYKSGNSNLRIENIEFPLCFAYNDTKNVGLGGVPIGSYYCEANDEITFTLNLLDNIGIVNKFWKPFLDWYTNIPFEIEKEIQFSLLDLKNFDFSKKYLIKNKLYFIDKIQFAIDIEGNIDVSTCTLLPA